MAKIIYRLSRLPKHTSGQNSEVKQAERIKIIHSYSVHCKCKQQNIFGNEIIDILKRALKFAYLLSRKSDKNEPAQSVYNLVRMRTT